jgi:rhamnulokinase
MAERCYLAVDLGAESGRVIAGLFDGGRIRLEEIHRFRNGAVSWNDSLRWDIVALWRNIQEGLTKGATQWGGQAESVGVDTWGVDYVLLGPGEELLGLPYNYRDRRTAGVMDQAWLRVPRAEIFASTGLQFMSINTLYQLIAMRQQNPGLLAQAQRFLMMPDLFHWLLSGSQVCEFTNATTSQCLDAGSRQWALPLLRQFEIPTDIFPQIVDPGTRLGSLRPDVAQATGLGRLPVVTPATHDTGSAVAAVPTRLTGTGRWAYISSGTWSLMGLELSRATLSPQALARNVTNEGGLDGTWRLLKNIMGLWLVQECRRAFEKQGRAYDYAQVVKLAAEAPAFGSLVDPDFPGFLSPEDMPTAIRSWCATQGEPVPSTDGAVFRCAFESLALKYRQVLGWLEELSGERVEVLHVVGGGSQNELLNQFTANATGRPVIAGPVEATALGNVLVQARTAGAVGSLAQMRDVVRASCELKTFEPQAQSEWRHAAARFDALLAKSAR